MPLHQALYAFNTENTVLQCIKHEIMYMGNKCDNMTNTDVNFYNECFNSLFPMTFC